MWSSRGALLAVVLVTGCTAQDDPVATSTAPTAPSIPSVAGQACETRYEVVDVAPSTTGSAGSSPGRVHDGPPNHVENNRWKRRVPLSAGDHSAAVTAAGRVRPALEALCAGGTFALDPTRRAFTDAGYPANDVYVQPFPEGVVYSLHPGGRACVMGHVRPGQVLIEVDGVNGEGSCVEASSH